ncbi:tetratricopeptide repeat protein, partial [Pyxidicoccus sp. 3LFB2]
LLAARRGTRARGGDCPPGELTAAEAALQTLTREQPNLDYAWTNLGIVQERLGRPDDAERSYRQALAVAPEQEAAWDCLARLYGRTGRLVKLEAELRGLLEARKDSVPLRTALAITLLQQKKHESAANEAKLALKGDERHVRAMQVLAQVYYREGKHELSRMVLENARAIDATDAATHNALGLVYLALKARPQALEAFKEAARLRPDFAEARNNFGAMLNEAQDYPAAVAELEAAVRAAPDFASARLNLGNAYRGQGDFERARAEYEQVLKLRPDLADPLFNLAILYLDVEPPGVDTLERYKTVLSYFEQYEGKGGRDERIAQYVKDARKGMEREERRRERERKDQLRKAEEQQQAEAQKAAAEKQAAPA